ncbi:MAG: hypothetical protein JRJ08_04520 [Deltaproteobacteria bacterium]|nr:hypothetical protein [Deltaproteobacteria bacterium]
MEFNASYRAWQPCEKADFLVTLKSVVLEGY